MGSFGGHALPGSFFIAFGLYWTVQFYRRLFSSMRRGGKPFYATVTFDCGKCRSCESLSDRSPSGPASAVDRRQRSYDESCCRRCCSRCCSDMDWEGAVIIFFTVVGFMGEVITATHNGRFTHIGNGQHATMFFFFGLAGLVCILVRRRSPILPPGSDYFFGALAFVVETLLFMFHLHGRTSLDVLLHTLLVYVLYVTIINILLEAWYRSAPIFVFIRAFLVTVQGTWFWQVGFILYNPVPGAVPWKQEDHEQIMVATMLFGWHIAAVLGVMIAIGAFIQLFCYRDVVLMSSSFNQQPKQGSNKVDPERGSYQDEVHLLTAIKSSKASNGKTQFVVEDADEFDSDTECHFNRKQQYQQLPKQQQQSTVHMPDGST